MVNVSTSYHVILTNYIIKTQYKRIYKLVTEPLCPLMYVNHARANTSGCLTDDRCQIGTVLKYACNEGFDITTAETVCLANQVWSETPTCVKREGRHQFVKFIYFYTMYAHPRTFKL